MVAFQFLPKNFKIPKVQILAAENGCFSVFLTKKTFFLEEP